MKMEYFPFCCSIKVLGQFGGTYAADHVVKHDPTALDIYQYIKKCEDQCLAMGQAAMVVTTNDQQLLVNETLKGMGFQHTQWMAKDMHPETKVRMWWLELND